MMGPSSEALLRDAVVFYISSENRCADPLLCSTYQSRPSHPSAEEDKGQRGTNNNIIRSYEFLEMSFPPPPPKKKRRREAVMPKRATHGTRTGHK